MTKTGVVVYRNQEADEYYQLQCLYCDFPLFFYDEPYMLVKLGDKVTCATCSKTFVVTGNCYKAAGAKSVRQAVILTYARTIDFALNRGKKRKS